MKVPWRWDWRLGEYQVFVALTIIVGIVAGLSAVLFSIGIDAARQTLLGSVPSTWRLLTVPALVSLVTGLLLARFFNDARGSGVPQTKVAYHLRRGVIPPRVPFGKFLTGILCIGSGHSMGREGPSVQIGAGLASWIGQRLRLPPAQVRDLVPVGASAALAAAFNTPVAAVLFSLEEIIADLNAPLLGSTVIASVAAVMVERSILGNQPLFDVPSYALVHVGELGAYAVLGVIGGIASLVFSKGLLGLRAGFRRLPAWTQTWQPAMGGLVIGVVLVFVPEVAGVGYEYVDQALNGGLVVKTLVLFCVVKMGATIVSYASGNAGGIFAPSLYFGAMLGGAIGVATRYVAPFPVAEPGAYALVGMGALFAGIIRAPMTSVFMIFEITQDYQILVPLMVANMLSFYISRRYQPEPIYHALLRQDRVHLPDASTARKSGSWRARDVMSTAVVTVPASTTVSAALGAIPHGHGGVIVGAPEHIRMVVSRVRLLAEIEAGRRDQPIGDLVPEDYPHVHPDHGLDVVLQRLRGSCGVLPVLSRMNVRQAVGVITPESLVGAPPESAASGGV